MAGKRVAAILRSKTNLTSDQIEKLSDSEGWRLIYNIHSPKVPRKNEVCFTGFAPKDKEYLWNLATKAGFQAVKSVTKHLTILCIGETPGPVKLQKAQDQKALVINLEDFKRLLEPGNYHHKRGTWIMLKIEDFPNGKVWQLMVNKELEVLNLPPYKTWLTQADGDFDRSCYTYAVTINEKDYSVKIPRNDLMDTDSLIRLSLSLGDLLNKIKRDIPIESEPTN